MPNKRKLKITPEAKIDMFNVFEKGYRLLVVDNFIVFYTVDDVFVKIINVLYEKRNYSNLL